MDIKYKLGYFLEHGLLPKMFFNDKGKFVNALLSDKGFLYRIAGRLYSEENALNPYHQEDFSVMSEAVSDEVMMIDIRFPEPEYEPLCYHAYLFYDKAFENTGYFCIEKAGSVSGDSPFICSWTPEGKHVNYGTCTLDENENINRCKAVYLASGKKA